MSDAKVHLGGCGCRKAGNERGELCMLDSLPCTLPIALRPERAAIILPEKCPYRPAPEPKSRLVRVKVEECIEWIGKWLTYQFDGQSRRLSSAMDDPRFRGYLWPDGWRQLSSPWTPVNRAMIDGPIEHCTEVEFEVSNA